MTRTGEKTWKIVETISAAFQEHCIYFKKKKKLDMINTSYDLAKDPRTNKDKSIRTRRKRRNKLITAT